jgi:hypothetical protein
MGYSNASILVTPGVGETVATHTADNKELQVFIPAGATGHLKRTTPSYIFATTASANVAAARTTHIDLFNAVGTGVTMKVYGIYIIPALAAVTGVGLTWELIKTADVGTGGVTLTGRPYDSQNAGIPAGVTARSKPTGGATTNFILQYVNTSSEETIPYASQASILNHVATQGIDDLQPIVLRNGEGLKIDQTTNSAVGTTTFHIIFTLE